MVERGVVGIHLDALFHDEGQRAQIVDAVGLVGMGMRHQHAVEWRHARGQQLLAHIGRGVDQHRGFAPRRTSSEQRRRRFLGLAGSQAPQSPLPSAPPSRGTPADEPQPRMVAWRRSAILTRASLSRTGGRNWRWWRRRVRRADALQLRQHRSGVHDEGRFVAFAARGLRREKGRIGFDQQPVERHVLDGRAQAIGFLEGRDSGNRNVEAEFQRRAREPRRSGEAMDDAANRAPPLFLGQDRDGVVLGVARVHHERQLRLRGPAAIWARKFAICASRGLRL